jgi:hypothetical protein
MCWQDDTVSNVVLQRKRLSWPKSAFVVLKKELIILPLLAGPFTVLPGRKQARNTGR